MKVLNVSARANSTKVEWRFVWTTSGKLCSDVNRNRWNVLLILSPLSLSLSLVLFKYWRLPITIMGHTHTHNYYHMNIFDVNLFWLLNFQIVPFHILLCAPVISNIFSFYFFYIYVFGVFVLTFGKCDADIYASKQLVTCTRHSCVHCPHKSMSIVSIDTTKTVNWLFDWLWLWRRSCSFLPSFLLSSLSYINIHSSGTKCLLCHFHLSLNWDDHHYPFESNLVCPRLLRNFFPFIRSFVRYSTRLIKSTMSFPVLFDCLVCYHFTTSFPLFFFFFHPPTIQFNSIPFDFMPMFVLSSFDSFPPSYRRWLSRWWWSTDGKRWSSMKHVSLTSLTSNH